MSTVPMLRNSVLEVSKYILLIISFHSQDYRDYVHGFITGGGIWLSEGNWFAKGQKEIYQ